MVMICSKDVKAKKEKSKLSKIEQKELTEAKTLHYLKNSDQGAKLAAAMSKKLEEAPDKEVDVGVTVPNSTTVNTDSQMSQSLRVSDKYDRRNWLQRATIVFIFLHPKIGAKNSADTVFMTPFGHPLSLQEGYSANQLLVNCQEIPSSTFKF